MYLDLTYNYPDVCLTLVSIRPCPHYTYSTALSPLINASHRLFSRFQLLSLHDHDRAFFTTDHIFFTTDRAFTTSHAFFITSLATRYHRLVPILHICSRRLAMLQPEHIESFHDCFAHDREANADISALNAALKRSFRATLEDVQDHDTDSEETVQGSLRPLPGRESRHQPGCPSKPGSPYLHQLHLGVPRGNGYCSRHVQEQQDQIAKLNVRLRELGMQTSHSITFTVNKDEDTRF
jgi:hypothetical protein